MYVLRLDPGAAGAGVAFCDAIGPDGAALSLGGAHGSAGTGPGTALLERDLGVRLAVVRQVHGTTVLRVTAGNLDEIAQAAADGLVTTEPGIALTVRVADCIPALFVGEGVVGAAHAGRAGLAAGMLQATVAAMRALGADRIEAWLGPHICGACYEVPPDLQREVAAVVPDVTATTSWGTPALDLGRGAGAVLRALGVVVHEVPGCTRERVDLHSYRRDGAAAGRQAGLVWLGR